MLTDDEVTSIEGIVCEAFDDFGDQENTPSARRVAGWTGTGVPCGSGQDRCRT
jgi:hypothetical protein